MPNRWHIHAHDGMLTRMVHQMATLCAKERDISLLQLMPKTVVLPTLISSIKQCVSVLVSIWPLSPRENISLLPQKGEP